MLVGVATVVELESADLSKSPPGPPDTPSGRRTAQFLRWTERLTLGVFTAEVVFKLIAKGDRPDRYFFDEQEGNWNSFVFLVVVMSFVSNVSIMRLVRLLKVLGKVPALKVLLLGLMAGVSAVSSIMLLMLLIIFLFGIVAVLYFGDNDPAHFGKLERAMLSLFQCATLSGWGEVYQVAAFGCDRFDMGLYLEAHEGKVFRTSYGVFHNFDCSRPRAQPIAALFFFFVFTVLTAMVVLSLFISVITMCMLEIVQMKRMISENADLMNEDPPARKRALGKTLKRG